jgi:N-acetylmuramoyl-L-alanine amidase
MRSFGRITLAVALTAALLPARAHAQSTQAADLYQQARALEAALRQELNSAKSSAPSDLLTRMRTLAKTYEDLWRLFPTSPYSDDALCNGAMLSADAFWQTGDAADRTRALRLFQVLSSKFPTSSLIKKVAPQVARLQAAKPTEPPPRTVAAVPATITPIVPAAAAPAQTSARTPAVSPATAASSYATLTSIRRDVLPDAVRVTLELEREPVFNAERIEGPSRVFIDMQNTRASEPLKDASLPFKDDVVRQIRVGRQLNGRTRVVLDLSGAGKYSVYTLYNPFRIVIDFARPTSGAPALAQPPATLQASGVASPSIPAARTAAAAPADARKPGVTTVDAAPAVVPSPSTRATAPPPSAATRPAARQDPPSALAPARAAATTPDAGPATVDKPRATIAKGPEPGDTFTRPLPPAAAGTSTPTPATTAPPVPPTANSTGSFSLSRQLGLGIARIVIDPGHGGHDPGAQANGLSEAEVTLDIALRLEKLLTKQSGVQVVLTRRDDTFVQLQERTAIANRTGADLFLSIHANANEDPSLRGIETYFLNLSSNPEAARVVARENASSSRTMHDFEDIVKAIALNDKIDESRDFATLVQASLYEKLRASNRETRNLGVKQAPFMVLIGATMPSVLAEISFMTNRQELGLLKTDKYRQQIAEALYQGVMRYQQALKRVPAIAMQQ